MTILVGTSGYSYKDWQGFVYPKGVSQKDFLTHYATLFSVVELNFSYYRMPQASMLARMVERTEGRLGFAIKCHKTLTHDRVDMTVHAHAFLEGLAPLVEAGVLEAVLAQFPTSFKATRASGDYVRALVDHLAGMPVVIEFRQARWIQPATMEYLRSHGVGLCVVDEPDLPGLVPPTVEVTGPIAYLRFHGRNAAKWYHHDSPHERYDYRYDEAELEEWVPKIRAMDEQADKTLVFFNNHYQGKAVVNAKRLEELLDIS